MDDVNSTKYPYMGGAVMDGAVYNGRPPRGGMMPEELSLEEQMVRLTQEIRGAEERIKRNEKDITDAQDLLRAADDSGVKNALYTKLERNIKSLTDNQIRLNKNLQFLREKYQAVYEQSISSNEEDDVDIDDDVYVDDEKFMDKIVHEDEEETNVAFSSSSEFVRDDSAENDEKGTDDVPESSEEAEIKTRPSDVVVDSTLTDGKPENEDSEEDEEDDDVSSDVETDVEEDESGSEESQDEEEEKSEDSEKKGDKPEKFYIFCSAKNAYWRKDAQDGLPWTGDLEDALLLEEKEIDKKIEAIMSIFGELELVKLGEQTFVNKEESKKIIARDIDKVYESALSNGLAAVFGSDDTYNELLHVTSVFLTTTPENDIAIMYQMPNATMLKQKQGWIREYGNLTQLFKKGVDDNSSIILAKQSINDERSLTEVFDVSQTMVSIKRKDVVCSNELMLKVLFRHYSEIIVQKPEEFFFEGSVYFYDHTQNKILAKGNSGTDSKAVYQLMREIAFFILANEKYGIENYVRGEIKGVAMAVASIVLEKLYSNIRVKCNFPDEWKSLNQRNWLIDVFQNQIKNVSLGIVEEIHEDIETGLKLEKEKYHEG